MATMRWMCQGSGRTGEQIDRWEMALDLALRYMDDEDRRLVWAVCQSAAFRQRGPRWSRIAQILGLNDPTDRKAALQGRAGQAVLPAVTWSTVSWSAMKSSAAAC